MLAPDVVLDLADYMSSNTEIVSDEVEQEITSLLRAKAPALSPRNTFRIAESLIDTAVATIVTLRGRIASLEAERDKFITQEKEWEALLAKWRDMAVGLKDHIRDLESRLAQSNQNLLEAELRVQHAEEDTYKSQQGSYDLCDKVIAAFGEGTSLIERVGMVTGEVAGSC